MTQLIKPQDFTKTVTLLRDYFTNKGFLEVHTQNRLSILAACEDPATVATFDYAGEVWPLPQTGQMWLEYELLNNPNLPGVFCVSTSYRQEPNPVPGRHDLIFPMFEFESKGDMEDLKKLENELCVHLGFGTPSITKFPVIDYEDICKLYNQSELDHNSEARLFLDYGDVVLLQNFPYRTSPFWNMKKLGEIACKVDVIICGNETIGSAERSTNPNDMHDQFHTISNGLYSDLLFSKFGRSRVLKELEEFLSFNFFPRFGGGIGMTRLQKAMKHKNII